MKRGMSVAGDRSSAVEAPPIATTHLHPQLHHRRPTATLMLRWLRHRFHVRMLLQILPQSFPQNAHTAAVHHAHSRQSSQKGPVYEFLYLACSVVHGTPDDVDFRRHTGVLFL